MACSPKGEVCVVKFSNTGDRIQLEEEKEGWFEVPQVQVITLGGQSALVMPYYKTLQDGQEVDEETLKAIKEAIVEFAERGYQHVDLCLRHVGVMTSTKEG